MNLSPETVLLLARDLTVPLARKMTLPYRERDWGGRWHRQYRVSLRFIVHGPDADRARLVLAASEIEVWG